MIRHRLTNLLSISIFLVFATAVVAPTISYASVEGRRNTAIGLSAGALLSAIRGNPGAAIALGAGAAYGWKRYHDARSQDAYRRGYYYGYSNGYYHPRYGRGPYAYHRYYYHNYRHHRYHHHRRYARRY